MQSPILIPVSAGELIDKITILEIKAARISDPGQLGHVMEELALLTAARDRWLASSDLTQLSEQLRVVNQSLWAVEDALRLCERQGQFDARFVELARSVYRHNDHRSALKRRINEVAGSPLVEEKSYPAYGGQ